MKVLLVEDEKKVASFIRKGLEARGVVVEVSPDGTAGDTLALTRSYDALMPVIPLTARSELYERLEGLNRGADDHLTKPLFVAELTAHLYVVTRRATATRRGS